jgi:hypothetical protein
MLFTCGVGPWFPSNPDVKKLIRVAMADNRVKVTVRACFTAKKYTRKQTLWCRFCYVTYRNNRLRGRCRGATYMHRLGRVSMLLLFQVP